MCCRVNRGEGKEWIHAVTCHTAEEQTTSKHDSNDDETQGNVLLESPDTHIQIKNQSQKGDVGDSLTIKTGNECTINYSIKVTQWNLLTVRLLWLDKWHMIVDKDSKSTFAHVKSSKLSKLDELTMQTTFVQNNKNHADQSMITITSSDRKVRGGLGCVERVWAEWWSALLPLLTSDGCVYTQKEETETQR